MTAGEEVRIARAPARRRPTGSLLRGSLRFQALAPALALVALVMVVGLTHTRFFSGAAVDANVRAAAFVAIIGCGMVFLLAMGEIDLSVGGSYGLCFYVAAKLASEGGVPIYLAALIAIAVGVLLGAVNGLLTWLFRASTIIVTLGTFSLYAGIVSVVSEGQSVGPGLPVSSSFFTSLGSTWIGFPVAGWVAVGVCLLLTVVLTRSRLGAMVRAAGSNPSAAAFSGIPTVRLRIWALMLTGGLAGLSAVLTLAYAQGADPSIGSGFELQVIAAAIIGGTSIAGGEGTVPGAVIGALIVVTVNSALVFFDVNPLWGNVVTGIVILIAVGSAALLTHGRRQSASTSE